MAQFVRQNLPFTPPAPIRPAPYPYPPGYPPAPVVNGLLPRKGVGWLWQFLIVGYSTFGRSFAYLGVKPLFIGEAYLGLNILGNRNKWMNRFIGGCIQLEVLPLAILATILWGLVMIAVPVLQGRSVMDCVRTCAFNYYPLFVPIGIAIGRTLLLSDFIRFFKLYVVLYTMYGIVNIAVGGMDIAAPWSSGVPLFSPPALAPLIPVGILAMWPLLLNWSWRWALLPMSMIPMFYSTGRGTILGFILGLGVVACGSMRRFVFVGGTMGTLLVILMIVGPMIKGANDRAENFDPIINIGRIIATFDEDLAYRMLLRRGYHGAAEEMLVAKGTAGWRKTIWTNAMNSLNTTTLLAIGHGHGSSVGDLTPDGQEIHTPHNFVIYAIYYTGVIGLVIFCGMVGALFFACYYIPDPSVRLLQLSHVMMMCMVALVGNMFETPIAAVPFYLFSGVCLGLEAGWPKRYA